MSKRKFPVQTMEINAKKFFQKVAKTDECWEWKYLKTPNGYGKLRARVNGIWEYLGAHRISFVIHKGQIPEGFHVAHRCNNKGCVNPEHLYLATPRQNTIDAIRDGLRKKHTHCPNGHEYLEGSFYLDSGRKKCKQCIRKRAREYYYKKKDFIKNEKNINGVCSSPTSS